MASLQRLRLSAKMSVMDSERAVHSDLRTTTPRLSLALGTLHSWHDLAAHLNAMVERLRDIDGELVIASDKAGDGVPAEIRWIVAPGLSLLALRELAVREATGEIIAVGEDHAAPGPLWCEAVLRAHSENPDTAVLVGSITNGTATTVAGRANFLAFAAAWTPGRHLRTPERPPPISTCSFKRDAVKDLANLPGALEARLLTEFFLAGRMVLDPRIRVDHFQDHGLIWAVRNSFVNARTAYGCARLLGETNGRLSQATWILRHVPKRQWREAFDRPGLAYRRPIDALAVAVLVAVTGLGGAVGTLLGPGRPWERAE